MALTRSDQSELVELNFPNYLENNILDEDFIKVFEPYRSFQKLLGSSRVDVKNNSVTVPTIYQKCYTVFCMILMTISVIKFLEVYYLRFNDKRHLLMYFLWMGGISAVLVVFSTNIIHSRFMNNKSNVELHIKLQKIDRVMRINRNINTIHFKQNRRMVIALAITFMLILLLSVVLAKEEFGFLELAGASYILQTLVFELSNCSSHIRFFYMRVRLINAIILKHFKRGHCSIEVLSQESISADHLANIPAEFQEFETSATDIYINEIIEGFSSFQDLYQFQIFVFCVVFVAWILFTFEYGIFTLQNNHLNQPIVLLDYLLLLSLSAMELILLLVLCIHSEVFFREIYKTKQLSVLVMSRYAHGPLRKKAKSMFKLIEMSPPCFSVYGLWRMDVYLLLDIFNLITTLFVTILQLTF